LEVHATATRKLRISLLTAWNQYGTGVNILLQV